VAKKKKPQPLVVSLSEAKESISVTRPLSKLPGNVGSLTKLKAVFGLVRLAKTIGDDVQAGVPYEATYEDMRTMLGCRDDEHLAHELNNMPAQLPAGKLIQGAKGWIGLIPTCWWKDGVVHWEFASFLVDELLDEDSGYHQMNWEVLVSFQGLYAAKIYLYVCPYVGGKKQYQPPPLSTVELRELLGVPANAYPPSASGMFHSEIRRNVATLNKTADGFSLEYLRTGRGAAALHHFKIGPAIKQGTLPLHKMASKSTDTGTVLLRDKILRALTALPEDRRIEVETAMNEKGFPELPDNPRQLQAFGGALRGLGVL
jgi:hypothetical protein